MMPPKKTKKRHAWHWGWENKNRGWRYIQDVIKEAGRCVRIGQKVQEWWWRGGASEGDGRVVLCRGTQCGLEGYKGGKE